MKYIKEINEEYYQFSDDEIQDGDWCIEVASFYPTGLSPILQCIKRMDHEMRVSGGWIRIIKWPNKNSKVEMKKIIASSNKRLGLPEIPNDGVFYYELIEYIQSLENEVGGRNPYYCNKLREITKSSLYE